MKFVMYQDCISPHQLPLARELVKRLGADNFRYVYRDELQVDRVGLGWKMYGAECWLVHMGSSLEEAKELIESADTLLTIFRDVELIRRRNSAGLRTLIQTERWFKPIVGIWRLLSPSYLKMACRFVGLLRSSDKVIYLPIGINAAKDMARLSGLLAGDLKCLLRAPNLDFERKTGSHIWLRGNSSNPDKRRKYNLGNMRMWGYYVEPSNRELMEHCVNKRVSSAVKLLWVGRLLRLKRVDTIIRAVQEVVDIGRRNNSMPRVTLDIYGGGPEEVYLKKLASRYREWIRFYSPVAIDEVRKLMREHDVYVLASDSYEGWGAVVSEALEEGAVVIGTYEAGASATILPESHLFHTGDWRTLGELLRKAASKTLDHTGIGSWTAKVASERILEFCNI